MMFLLDRLILEGDCKWEGVEYIAEKVFSTFGESACYGAIDSSCEWKGMKGLMLHVENFVNSASNAFLKLQERDWEGAKPLVEDMETNKKKGIKCIHIAFLKAMTT